MDHLLQLLIDNVYLTIPLHFSTDDTTQCVGGCVGILTRLNFCWTSKVHCHNAAPSERPIMLSYGHNVLPYDQVTMVGTSPRAEVRLTGRLGDGTHTSFQQLNIDIGPSRTVTVLIMSYVRFGNEATFLLIDADTASNASTRSLITQRVHDSIKKLHP
jgi:hypothetical protein